jgi:hypothetical protein
MKGSFFVIGGLLWACMLVLGVAALAQDQPVAVPEQASPPGQAIALEGEKPATSQPQQGKKGQEGTKHITSHKKKQKTQDADR